MAKWLDGIGESDDVVLSTRVRVARNISKYKFPRFMSIEESDLLTEEVLESMKKSEDLYRFYRIKDLNEVERSLFVEEHLISPNLCQDTDKGSFLVRDDEKITIMINEEDHLRLQVLLYGLNLEEAWRLCSETDDYLESNMQYAFDNQLGYLTACPTNVGTGLRASVMLHLPTLAMTGNLNPIIEAISKMGLTVRGLYGEGTKSLGHFYQISNQITLGESEEDIIKKLNKIILQIVSRERNIRAYILDKRRNEVEDRIFRSLGILKYSRIMTSAEAMNHLSNVKLGCNLGIIQDFQAKEIVKTIMDIQPATIQENIKEYMEKEERDIYRAELIRKRLINMEG